MNIYIAAKKPTMYFIGVTTGKSSIMNVFPAWAKYLEFGDVEIKGIDFVPHSAPALYREAIHFIKNDPLSLGALVTTHKMDLLSSCLDQFDALDPFANMMHEISSVSKTNKQLVGHAKDPITSGLSLEAFLPNGHWEKTGAEACILGAGGSGIALSWYLTRAQSTSGLPSKLYVVNRSPARIEEMKAIHEKTGIAIPVEYIVTGNDASIADNVVSKLQPGSLVVNATGLGKDAPGSPLSDNVIFPKQAIVWDFNYRGELKFLEQARHQKAIRQLQIEDGWLYFIHGWTRVIAEVFHRDIPSSGPVFEELSRIAANTR